MRKLLLIMSSLFIAVLILFALTQENPKTPEISSNHKIKNKKTKQKSHSIPSENLLDNSNSILPSETHDPSIDPDRDYLLWNKKSNEIEDAWNKEIYSHIQYIDREHAEGLYSSYLKERNSYLAPQEKNLSDTLDDFSRLNGESIDDPERYTNAELQQDEFITNLRRIFRQNYEYIETQRKVFLDAHVEPE
jgi:hypothetical protein